MIFFIPLICAGLLITRLVANKASIEKELPIGLFAGASLYIFSVNIFSYLFTPLLSIVITYILCILLALIFIYKNHVFKVEVFFSRSVLVWFLLTIICGYYLYWYLGKVNFGGDIELYYSYARTFEKGNFPLMTPWQPDLPSAYHYGSSLLISGLRYFTNLPYEFLHRALGLIYVLGFIHFFFWYFWDKKLTSLHKPLMIVATVVINFGTWFIVWPHFPIKFPEIQNFSSFLLWLSNQPTAGLSYETYGGSVNSLGTIVYFLPTLIAFGTLLWSIFLVWRLKHNDIFKEIVVIMVSFLSLSLINETYLIVSVLPLSLLIITRNFSRLYPPKKVLFLVAMGIVFTILFTFQGGIVTDSFLVSRDLEKSVILFPKESDFPFEEGKLENIKGYFKNQQSSHEFPLRDIWLPLQWYQVGIVNLYVISIVLAIIIFWKGRKENFLVIFTFILIAICSSVAYNTIITKFVVANGNRFLALSYHMVGLALILETLYLLDIFKSFRAKVILLIIILWVFIPSTLPSIGQLYLAKGNNNKFKEANIDYGESINWMYKNVPFNNRVIDMVKGSPFTSRPLLTLREAGVFSPVFNSRYRAYTIEASPEYIDAVYTLNPSVLKELKVSLLLIDSEYFKTLDPIRQNDVKNSEFFEEVFRTASSTDKSWEKILKVKELYLSKANDLTGTYKELRDVIPDGSRVYIDEWKNVDPWNSLRKSLIFNLKDKKPYLVWGPGVYLNVETFVPVQPFKTGQEFDYLVLFKDTDPVGICECNSVPVWKGVKGNIIVWKRVDSL